MKEKFIFIGNFNGKIKKDDIFKKEKKVMSPVEKKSTIRLYAVLCFLVCFLSTGCIRTYDIRGVWDFVLNFYDEDFYEWKIAFVGEKGRGDVLLFTRIRGEYFVNGNSFDFTVKYINDYDNYVTIRFVGNIDSGNILSGQLIGLIDYGAHDEGTFYAERSHLSN